MISSTMKESVVLGPVQAGWFEYLLDGGKRWNYVLELSCGHTLRLRLPRDQRPRRVRRARGMSGYGAEEWAGLRVTCPVC